LADRAVPLAWVKDCATKFRRLRQEMRNSWVGYTDALGGPLVDWLLAACLARENALLLGPPGSAKSQIALRLLELLGLGPPKVDPQVFLPMPENIREAWDAWQARSRRARAQQKYFHYLVNRFTQPDELFGPIEISLLRQGVLARVNFGLLTGPGVWAAFLDELFKASSSIINTLLTLALERRYFNWGGMQPADLVLLIGASNEMPGGFATGAAGIGAGGEDFQTMYAFVDRFPIRLFFPIVSGGNTDDPLRSDLAQAFAMAMARESQRFVHGHPFGPKPQPEGMPCINDLLVLGRGCYQHEPSDPFRSENLVPVGGPNAVSVFRETEVKRFQEAFLRIAIALQADATNPAVGQLTWTISPRKLQALYKIALAHALVADDGFLDQPRAEVVSQLGTHQLHVFDFIWDSPSATGALADQNKALIDRYT
jgi:MoxR-like ATPase